MNSYRIYLFLLCHVIFAANCLADDLSHPSVVVFHGKQFHEASDLSAVAVIGNYLVIGSDEGHVIQVLNKTSQNTFELVHKYSVEDGQLLETDRTDKKDLELDIEGIATTGNQIYIIGSHSKRRKKVEIRNTGKRSAEKNRKRLSIIENEDDRRVLLRARIDEHGKLGGTVESADLWGAIKKFKQLEPFTKIPSKENGIDIEGIAARGAELFIGFRGPVFTGNWVPVLVTKFEDPVEQAKLLYVNLGGLGIRDMVSLEDGQFLLIAGPVGDGPGGFHLYSWNGLDCVPDEDQTEGIIQYLGEIPTDTGAKAEGITVLPNDRTDLIKLLILFDGPKGGNPISLTLRR